MPKIKYDDVKTLLVDSEIGSRDSFRGALHNIGFRDFRVGKTLHEVVSGLNQYDPDILICGTEFDEGSSSELVKKVRHSEIGTNPFIPIVFVTSDPSKKIVGDSLNAGADILLVKPVSTNDIIERVSLLINQRKSFIVTTDYIGPDRRKGKRSEEADEDGIEQILVPNRLKAKATGDKEALDDNETIKNSLAKINNLKLERHAVQIGFLVEMILPAYENGDINEELIGYIDKINHVAADTSKRLRNTEYA
ncbi:MAG: response regulator, partial [Alphaproteobacteria bacterium]|nr:response regulator [Alphaproteobacteria bacterium]